MYSTATVSTAALALTALRDFCVANGWTVNTDQVEGAGRRITISKIANSFMHFRLAVNETSAVPSNGYGYGIGMLGSLTNNATSFASNNVFNYNPVMAPINHTVPVTYHFFSSADGNNIAVAFTSFMLTDLSKEYNTYLGFGTSLNKTTTVNETWYWYGGSVNSQALDYGSQYSILNASYTTLNSFLVSNGTVGSSAFGQFGFYSTTPFYTTSGMTNFYTQTYSGGTYGIVPLNDYNAGIGGYNYLFQNTASSAYANTVLIPSYVFMKHPTVGCNLIGSVPLVWAHNSVPILYKSGTHVTINGKDYALFRNHAYEVIP